MPVLRHSDREMASRRRSSGAAAACEGLCGEGAGRAASAAARAEEALGSARISRRELAAARQAAACAMLASLGC